MASTKYTSQLQQKVSVNRKELEFIACDSLLDENDLRVLLILLTKLEGFDIESGCEDPYNFTKVNSSTIANTLKLKEKDVKKSMKNLRKMGYIEKGSSPTVENGWRFRF